LPQRRVSILLCALLLGAITAVSGQAARPERDEPPRADRITLSAPDENGAITITGAENSVYSGAVVGIRNLYSGELVFAPASFIGAFSAQLPGVPGNPFLIQADNDYPARGAAFPAALPGDIGVIVRAPEAETRSAAGVYGGQRWTADVSVPSLAAQPGEPWVLALEIRTTDAQPFRVALWLQPVAQEVGGALQPATVAGSSGWSAETTPTGLPIDGLDPALLLGELTPSALPLGEDGRTRFRLNFDGPLPETLPVGLYAPLLELADGTRARLSLILDVGAVGEAPLTAVLFMDESANGARGLLPEAAVGALSHGASWNGPEFILPPGRYPLEPYLPALLPNRSDVFAAPLIPFDVTGGTLRVTVNQPDGSTAFLNAPLTQTRLGTTAEDERARFGGGPVEMLRLTTGTAAFAAYPFEQYGAYTVTVDLTVSDIFGHRYRAGGRYRLLIAEPLQLFPMLLPGTPIAVGRPVAAGVRLSPPVPAGISTTAEFVAADGERSVRRQSGSASRYGVYDPAEPLVFDTPGEYRLDTTATYTDEDGRLWAGSLRSAGVVSAANGPLIAHGARGLAGQPAESAPARYSLTGLAAQTGERTLLDGAVFNQPFFGGGAVHIGDSSAYALAFPLHLQDVSGAYARWLIEAGLTDGLSAARGNLPAALSGDAYAYISAVTPGVSVRQQVTGGASGGLPAWTDADDPLNQQIGAGVSGLAPGDLVFLFGGAVTRAPEAGVATAAGYAALAVVTDGEDTNTLGVPAPATLGAAPLAFIPTGVFPGQRLTVGERITVAGQVAPPLPAQITAELTDPDGETRTIALQADEFGYAFDPDTPNIADKPGVWTLRLRAETDFGTAAVPGTDGAAFSIFVLPAGEPPLSWSQPVRDSAIPGAISYDFNLTAPDDWTDVRGHLTMTTPGAVLADGEIQLAGRSFSAQYNPSDIRREFPNFEVEGRVPGAHVSDVVTLTVAFTGIDADGEAQIRARTFTLRHDRLIALEPDGGQP
jgi:hypothetical protein